ncbi:MAG: M36 family metallopeptidase, partial [Armatimonadota bacterium]
MKRHLRWLLSIAMLVALCNAVAAVQQVALKDGRLQIAGFTAPTEPDPSAVAAVAKVPTVSRPWMATWDPDTGRVRMLYNGETPALPGDLEARARAFLRANSVLFGLGDTSDLKTAEVLTHGIGETVRFQQFYRGVRVYPGDVAVSRNRDGRIFLVSSEYRPGLSFSTKPRVSQDEARREAVAQCGGGKVIGSELVVWGLTRPFRLAWQVDVDVDVGKLMRVFLDANTGRLISKSNRISAQSSEPLADIYMENPVATPQLTTVKLTNLDGSGTLSGKYAKVLKFTGYDNQENPQGQPDLRQGPEGFRVPPGDERFNQPSVYFHVNRMHDYFSKNFGYTKRDHQMPVYVSATRRDGRALNNAYFAPVGEGYLVFGKKDDGKDYALDSDVINHEYTHSVVETLCKIDDNPLWTEARAINEALADYYACTVNGNPKLGEYTSSSGRDLGNRFHYPEEVPMAFELRDGSLLYNFPEEHDTSRIWSGTLWDMRRALGAAVADKIIFNSLPLLPAAASFADGRVALRTADQQLNTGAGATIAKIMENRGIAEQAQYLYADPFAFGDDKTYLVVTGFISPEGGPIDVFGFLPVYVTGRRYLLSGIVDSGDALVQGVRLVFLDSNNQPVEKISPKADLARVMVLLRG